MAEMRTISSSTFAKSADMPTTSAGTASGVWSFASSIGPGLETSRNPLQPARPNAAAAIAGRDVAQRRRNIVSRIRLAVGPKRLPQLLLRIVARIPDVAQGVLVADEIHDVCAALIFRLRVEREGVPEAQR